MRMIVRAGRSGGRTRLGSESAFTFVETMVSMAVLTLVLSGLLTAHLFGLRLFELTKAKLGASLESRRALSLLTEEIRTAKIVRIGSGDASGFTEIPANTRQEGSAVEIRPAADTNAFIRYFLDPVHQQLKRTTSATPGIGTPVATCISNVVVFSSEDFKGNVLTNNENNRVIGLKLQFYQLQDPTIPIGPGNFYDFYQLRTKVTRRALE